MLNDPLLAEAVIGRSSSPQSSPSLDLDGVNVEAEIKKHSRDRRKKELDDRYFGGTHDYDSSSSPSSNDPAPVSESALFLRILAAADYYSLDATLMERVPPVAVDIILDPFLGNVFPRSLVPTAIWILVVAAIAVLVGWFVAAYFQQAVFVVEQVMAGSEPSTKAPPESQKDK